MTKHKRILLLCLVRCTLPNSTSFLKRLSPALSQRIVAQFSGKHRTTTDTSRNRFKGKTYDVCGMDYRSGFGLAAMYSVQRLSL
jgi:hypothetical protein